MKTKTPCLQAPLVGKEPEAGGFERIQNCHSGVLPVVAAELAQIPPVLVS
jgi:hypothetical protein